MNEIAHARRPLQTTQGAQHFPRLKWTLAEFERLMELGVFTEQDRVELIGGELVPMAAKGIRHEVVRHELHKWLRKSLPQQIDYAVEIGWRPDAETYLEPDLLIYPDGFRAAKVPAAEVLLLIEVAHASLADDKKRKAPIYAALGVREYWVVDAVTLESTVYREPTAGGYAKASTIDGNSPLQPAFIAGLALKLAGLDLE